MDLMIDVGKCIPQPRQYGKLEVDTGEKVIHTGHIALGSPFSNTQPIRGYLIDTADSLVMKTGQKISLNQKISDISKLLLALKWDLNHAGSQKFDLDISLFMTDAANKTQEENFIFYNNPKSRCGSIMLKEDHGLCVKECYNETVQIDLNRAPSHIQTLAITVTIDEADERGQNFGQISNAYLSVIDAASGKEILSYLFAEHLSIETAIVVTEIYRHKGEWKINAIGRGFKGGLEALCDNYGIETK